MRNKAQILNKSDNLIRDNRIEMETYFPMSEGTKEQNGKEGKKEGRKRLN